VEGRGRLAAVKQDVFPNLKQSSAETSAGENDGACEGEVDRHSTRDVGSNDAEVTLAWLGDGWIGNTTVEAAAISA
jgi:hypothetical protein